MGVTLGVTSLARFGRMRAARSPPALGLFKSDKKRPTGWQRTGARMSLPIGALVAFATYQPIYPGSPFNLVAKLAVDPFTAHLVRDSILHTGHL